MCASRATARADESNSKHSLSLNARTDSGDAQLARASPGHLADLSDLQTVRMPEGPAFATPYVNHVTGKCHGGCTRLLGERVDDPILAGVCIIDPHGFHKNPHRLGTIRVHGV